MKPGPTLIDLPRTDCGGNRPIPTELAELDGAPIAAVTPDANSIAGSAPPKMVPGTEPARITEFNLFSDGTVMKYIERPGFAPQQLLVDGAGRQYGVIRNASVADLICNGVNMFHLAKVQMDAELAAANRPIEGGTPNLIVQPHVSPKSLE